MGEFEKKLLLYESTIREATAAQYRGAYPHDLEKRVEVLRGEILAMRLAHKKPTWDGTITIENECYVNGLRVEPGIYRANLVRYAPKEEPGF